GVHLFAATSRGGAVLSFLRGRGTATGRCQGHRPTGPAPAAKSGRTRTCIRREQSHGPGQQVPLPGPDPERATSANNEQEATDKGLRWLRVPLTKNRRAGFNEVS